MKKIFVSIILPLVASALFFAVSLAGTYSYRDIVEKIDTAIEAEGVDNVSRTESNFSQDFSGIIITWDNARSEIYFDFASNDSNKAYSWEFSELTPVAGILQSIGPLWYDLIDFEKDGCMLLYDLNTSDTVKTIVYAPTVNLGDIVSSNNTSLNSAEAFINKIEDLANTVYSDDETPIQEPSQHNSEDNNPANENTITTQTSAENTSGEDEAVTADVKTGEEVITAQEAQETELQEKIRQICNQIDEVAEELNEGEIRQMTPSEYKQKCNEMINAAKMARYDNIETDISTYLSVVAFEALPDNIKTNIIKRYNKNADKVNNDYYGGEMVAMEIFKANSVATKIVCSSEKQVQLIEMFDKLCKDIEKESQKGEINGINTKTFYAAFNYAQEKLSNRGIFSHIVRYNGGIAFVKLLDEAKQLDGFDNYFGRWGGILLDDNGESMLPENPKNDNEQFFAVFGGIVKILEANYYIADMVLGNQVV